MAETVILDGSNLTIEQVIAVAYGSPNNPRVEISGESKTKIARAAAAVNTLVERGQIAYGITTGFGALKDRLIPREEVARLQQNILVSHAVGTGQIFDIPTTRAIMLIRANTLASGYSGIRYETLQRLVDLINKGIHPCIPEKGSLGASGDLAPLAHMSLVLIGEGEAEFYGEVLPGLDALKRAGLESVSLVAKEGLALTNGTSVMCALGVLETHRAELLMRAADLIACLSLEALNGTVQAFDERIHRLRPLPRQMECAAHLRRILENSNFTRQPDPKNIQDNYSLRCIPQVHGAIREAIAYLDWMMRIELNSVTDNPLIFVNEEDESIEVLSGGNFHGEPLAIALDYLSIAMAELGNISERRLMRLLDEGVHGTLLPAFLTRNSGLNSGFMIMQYTAAALATENKVLAHPSSVDTIPTSANIEDHVSMGCNAALHARQIISNVEHILSLELMSAAQGIDFRKEKLPPGAQLGNGTRAVYELVRKHVPFLESDTVLYQYIEKVKALVAGGNLHYSES
ncbi:MAG: histidine ammonia-lyase [Chloroflexi bacterium]|uniref:Histidine ammonia-lyase n=1 Tax=Candidatus Chlorohelix allophototropha TaxID=3003348 RepID=A0A8T7M5Z8_9CHLR|nr:histidine ammonia-lyase [Chloroflexota bacterium]WJW69437.1 histidine ammonia-lyase [Chloroflexota bacterium L227-S17]